MSDAKRYGIRIKYFDNKAPEITYLYDAENFLPIVVNKNGVDYGSWKDVWFIKDNIPVVLTYSGLKETHIDEYLNSGKFIDDFSMYGNLMSKFPKIYISTQSTDDEEIIIVSNVKYDETYEAPAYIDKNGVECDNLYLSIYPISKDKDKRYRSVQNQYIMRTNVNEVALKFSAKEEFDDRYSLMSWNTNSLIRYLMMILGKTDNITNVFGYGYSSKNSIHCGVKSEIEQFHSDFVTSGYGHNLVFHIENFICNSLKYFDNIRVDDKIVYVNNKPVIEYSKYFYGSATRFISTKYGRFPNEKYIIDEDYDNSVMFDKLLDSTIFRMSTLTKQKNETIITSVTSISNTDDTKHVYYMEYK